MIYSHSPMLQKGDRLKHSIRKYIYSHSCITVLIDIMQSVGEKMQVMKQEVQAFILKQHLSTSIVCK